MPTKRSNKLVSLVLVLTVLAITGCSAGASTEKTVTTIGYGTVTEITQTPTLEESGSISARQVSTVSWTAQGTIGAVLVTVGQEVHANDILMTLDQDSLPESTKISQLKLAQMVSAAAIAEAQQAVLDAQSNLTTAQNARTSLDYKDQDTIDNAYFEYVLAQEKYANAKADYDNWADEDDSSHYESDLAPFYTAMYNAKTDMDTKEYLYELYKSDSSTQTIAEYDSAIVLAQIELEEAQNYLSAISGGEVPADATGDKLLNFYQTKLSVDSVNLRAPFDGVVAAIYDEPGILVSNNHGSVVIVDRSQLSTSITVDETSVVQLSEGMKAEVTVDVLPDTTFSAYVSMIEPVGMVSNGVVYYDVEVTLDEADASIPLNATAEVNIQTQDPITSLVVPATAVQSDTTGEFVQTYDNGVTNRVDVVSGTILSDDTVIVTGNLVVGQQVVLIITTTTTTTNSTGLGGLFGGNGGGDMNNGADSGGGQMPSGGGDGQMPSGGGDGQMPSGGGGGGPSGN